MLLTRYMHPIWAAGLAGLGAYLAALADRLLRLHLLSRLAEQVVIVMMPPLALIFLVLGTIFVGIATPTEGGAMGATGALVMAFAKRRLTWPLLRQAMDSTARLSAFVIFILVGASVFTLVFRGVNGDLWVEHLLTSLPGGQLGFLIAVNVMVFVLAFFLDFFELAFIIIPLLAPVADKLGIDLIWFGVLLGVNMQTSFMHPPFGFALFYLRSVAPSRETVDRVTGRVIAPVTTAQIYWGAIPFVVIQLIMVGVLIAFPDLVLSALDRGPRSIRARSGSRRRRTFRANCRNSSSSDMSAAETMPRGSRDRRSFAGARRRGAASGGGSRECRSCCSARSMPGCRPAPAGGARWSRRRAIRCRAAARPGALLDCGDDAGAAQARVARRGRGDRVQRPRRGRRTPRRHRPPARQPRAVASVRQPRSTWATIFSRRPKCIAARPGVLRHSAESRAMVPKTARNDGSG